MKEATMKKVKVITARLNVRKTPTMNSEVLRIANKDDILEYTSKRNGWLRLKTTGYIMEEFVAPIEDEEETE